MKTVVRIQATFLSLLFVLSFPYLVTGQVLNKDGTIDCTEPIVLSVSTQHIFMSSVGEYESAKLEKSPVVFYKESDKYTFWYKILVKENCELTFEIYPTDQNDIYNFFLYRYDGLNFCKGIIDKSILPLRANLYKKEIGKSGTGLSSSANFAPTPYASSAEYYEHAYQRSILAKAGSIYYLNVYHTVGADCGHTMRFSACNHSLNIEAKHKPCYEASPEVQAILEELEKLKSISSIASITPMALEEIEVEETLMELVEPAEMHSSVEVVEESSIQRIKIKPIAIDARTEKLLHIEIEIIETGTGAKVEYRSVEEGLIEARLKPNTNYTLNYSSLGYETQQVQLPKMEDVTYLVTPPVLLKPKSIGTNIVLNNIYFHPNTHVFRNGAEFELERLLNFLKDNQRARIEIQGHTNGDYKVKPKTQYSHLSEAWNFQGSSKKLSKLRAGEVRDYLVSNGVEGERLTILGLGGEQMIISDPDDYEDRLVNMRVEIVILDI